MADYESAALTRLSYIAVSGAAPRIRTVFANLEGWNPSQEEHCNLIGPSVIPAFQTGAAFKCVGFHVKASGYPANTSPNLSVAGCDPRLLPKQPYALNPVMSSIRADRIPHFTKRGKTGFIRPNGVRLDRPTSRKCDLPSFGGNF